MKNKLVAAAGILSMVGVMAFAPFSEVFANDTSETTATLKVKGGTLEFSETLPNFDFGEFVVDGKEHVLNEESAPSIKINDYRGLANNWELTVKEVTVDSSLPFTDKGLAMTVKPKLNEEAEKEVVAINGESKLVMSGGRHENEVALSPQLTVPKEAAAGDYMTTLEWILKPAE